MKTKMIICISIFFFSFLQMLNASVPDSCLKLLQDPYHNFRNPGSVKADSCVDSPTYGNKYAFRYFLCLCNIEPCKF